MGDMLRCFLWICERTCCIGLHGDVFAATWCAKSTGLPVKRVRSAFRRLAESGYVQKDHEGGWSDWTGNIWCMHGYSLTGKGLKPALCSRIAKEESDRFDEWVRESEIRCAQECDDACRGSRCDSRPV